MARIFVPEGQRMAVGNMLANAGLRFGPNDLFAVRRVTDMAGMEGCAFAYCENHSTPVAYEMLIAARSYGLVELKLNDEAARARYARRAG